MSSDEFLAINNSFQIGGGILSIGILLFLIFTQRHVKSNKQHLKQK